jgi:hypothetical protein
MHEEVEQDIDETPLIDLQIIAIIKQLERQRLYDLQPSSVIKTKLEFTKKF